MLPNCKVDVVVSKEEFFYNNIIKSQEALL